MGEPPTVLNHLRSAYALLTHEVDTALMTHAGDHSLLRGRIVEVARYGSAVEQVLLTYTFFCIALTTF